MNTKNNRNIDSLIQLAVELSGGESREVFTGGTGAASVKIHYPESGKTTVIKLATTDGSGLNNGRRKLVREAEQIQSLRDNYPDRLAHLIPEVLRTWQTSEYGAVEYPFYEGATFASLLRSDGMDNFRRVLEDIITHTASSYMIGYRKSPSNKFFDQKVFARAKFRIKYTERSDPILLDMISKDEVIINGRSYINPQIILTKIMNNPEVMKIMRSEYLSACIHGDLNLRNVFITPDGVRLLDLRGSRQKWDVFYDLAKLIFTSGFDRICHFEFTPKANEDGTYEIQYKDATSTIHDKWEDVQNELEIMFESNPELQTVLNNEPNWKAKLRFIHAIHYLADCACRVESGSPLNQAFSSYILGTIYMNRFFEDMNAKTSAKLHYSLAPVFN